ncbi:hypothetical protein TRFO_21309 [Tritrichomonas foetus]|uniref:Uncharacterized protein n=1 Tax=Tritrichomonas foetus TaxID=1144522 RepID=A0A1J4KET8_9EUKA|nr:hypothetical protein TRFO_21309 [Tritrichomonas foetus]|eukprot:OHT09691.1 hypothetical protein TRFO_21309 [Tritrichomonas foetus]
METTTSTTNLEDPTTPEEFDIVVIIKDRKYRFSGRVLNHDSFTLKIINEDYTKRWAADFSANYIDDLTTKAGCVKRISVFWKMLINIASGESQTASLEILTTEEINEIRKNKNKPVEEDQDSKLYIILTQTSEYDKFHYPLPLPFMPFTYEEYAQTIQLLYHDNSQLHKSLIAADCTQAVISLENKVTEFAAMFEEMKRVKNEKIKKLQRKVRLLQQKQKEQLPPVAYVTRGKK